MVLQLPAVRAAGNRGGLARSRVVRVFTVWRPEGWRTPSGLVLGDEEGRIGDLEGPFAEKECAGYTALVVESEQVATVFYVYREGSGRSGSSDGL